MNVLTPVGTLTLLAFTQDKLFGNDIVEYSHLLFIDTFVLVNISQHPFTI